MVKPPCPRPILLGIGILALLVVLAPGGARAAGVYSSGLFQLGDGQPPPGYSGAAKIVHTDGQAGLDWSDVFDARGSLLAGGGRGVFLGNDSLGSSLGGSALEGAADLLTIGFIVVLGLAMVIGLLTASGNVTW